MANFALKRGPSTRLSGLAVEDGSFIITTDKHQLYADLGTARYSLGDILEVKNLPETDIIDVKFYYLTTDKCLYRHVDGAWVNISKSGVVVTTGATNGTISVNGTEVAVFGLGSAAFTDATAYDAAGAAAAVQGATDKTVKDAMDAAAAAQGTADGAVTAIGELDASLKAVAKSGAAADVSIADADDKFAATNVEAALAELAGKIGDTGEAGKVTVAESGSDDFAKVYDIKQNGISVGTINIPKDMVVEDGEVVTLTEADDKGHAAGTYLKLTLANANNKELWVPVGALIEYVSGGATAEITVSVDPVTHVATAVINDASVAKSKLTTDVQKSLGLADSAVQSVTVMGTELKDGDELTVDQAKTALGLGSAAYTEASAYDVAGAAADAKAAVIGTEADAETADTIYGAKAHADKLDEAMDARVQELETAIGEGGSVDTQIATAIGKLDVEDTAVAGQYVSAVAQADGKITVTRAALPDYSETYDAKGSADAAKAAVIGTTADAAAADTINGAKAYTNEAKAAVVGATGDAADANTVYGAKAYADAAVATATSWVEF